MELNQYLKELGLQWEDLPGNYISKVSLKIRLKRKWYLLKRKFWYTLNREDKVPKYNDYYAKPAFDKRNKIKKNGFCNYEFFSLDYSLALYIYPRLCFFRDNYAKYGTPMNFCYDENGHPWEDEDKGNQEWLKVINKMCNAFKLIIKDDTTNMEEEREHEKQIEEGLQLFAKHYRGLWW